MLEFTSYPGTIFLATQNLQQKISDIKAEIDDALTNVDRPILSNIGGLVRTWISEWEDASINPFPHPEFNVVQFLAPVATPGQPSGGAYTKTIVKNYKQLDTPAQQEQFRLTRVLALLNQLSNSLGNIKTILDIPFNGTKDQKDALAEFSRSVGIAVDLSKFNLQTLEGDNRPFYWFENPNFNKKSRIVDELLGDNHRVISSSYDSAFFVGVLNYPLVINDNSTVAPPTTPSIEINIDSNGDPELNPKHSPSVDTYLNPFFNVNFDLATLQPKIDAIVKDIQLGEQDRTKDDWSTTGLYKLNDLVRYTKKDIINGGTPDEYESEVDLYYKNITGSFDSSLDCFVDALNWRGLYLGAATLQTFNKNLLEILRPVPLNAPAEKIDNIVYKDMQFLDLMELLNLDMFPYKNLRKKLG